MKEKKNRRFNKSNICENNDKKHTQILITKCECTKKIRNGINIDIKKQKNKTLDGC